MRRWLASLLLAAPWCAVTAADSAGQVRFIACPVYRDTDFGKKSGCWLATDPATGMRYDVSQSPYKPDWNYAVLVEGLAVAAGDEPCGAPVLDPVRTSRLTSTCTRHMLPAEGYPGRKFVLPPRNNQPLSMVRADPPRPYTERTFTIFYEFDRDFMTYQYGDYLIDQAAHWIGAARPKKAIITGYAATESEIVSGQNIAERPEVAMERAEAVAETLRRLVPDLVIETRAVLKAKPVNHPDADGLPSQSQRRAEIRAVF